MLRPSCTVCCSQGGTVLRHGMGYVWEEAYVQAFKGPGVSGRMILKWLLRTWDGRTWTGFMLPMIGTSGRLINASVWYILLLFRPLSCQKTDKNNFLRSSAVLASSSVNFSTSWPSVTKTGMNSLPQNPNTECSDVVLVLKVCWTTDTSYCAIKHAALHVIRQSCPSCSDY